MTPAPLYSVELLEPLLDVHHGVVPAWAVRDGVLLAREGQPRHSQPGKGFPLPEVPQGFVERDVLPGLRDGGTVDHREEVLEDARQVAV